MPTYYGSSYTYQRKSRIRCCARFVLLSKTWCKYRSKRTNRPWDNHDCRYCFESLISLYFAKVVDWRTFPLIRFLIPFVIGIVFGVYSGTTSDLWGVFASLSLVLLVVVKLSGLPRTFRVAWIFGFLANAALFTTAVFLVIWNTPSTRSDFYQNFRSSDNCIIASVSSSLIEKPKSFQVKLSVRCVLDSIGCHEASGQLLGYLEKDTLTERLRYGDLIAIRSDFNPIEGSKNPNQFDFRSYMNYQGIYESGYIRSEEFISLNKNDGFFLLRYAERLRKIFLGLLETSGVQNEQFAVASALLLGQRDYLDAETVQAYSNAGAMHVLAVSGLHVGILYLVLNFILGFMDRWKQGRAFRCIIVLGALWMYAMVTGLSPSVLRATVMFSFVILAVATNRKSNIYNTIAASGLLLLIIDPFLLFHVGFQLSYLAVLGIIYFQPKIYRIVHFKNKVLNYTWKITTVSVAAQLATFPICIYYFHQFPVYFLISNLIVIPCAAVIFVLGIFSIATGFSVTLAGCFGYLLNNVIWLLNGGVKGINNLPFSVADGLVISLFSCCLLYFCILLIVLAGEQKKFKFLYGSALSLLLFVCLDIYEDYQLRQNKLICFYSVRGNLGLDCIVDNRHVFVSGTSLYKDPKLMKFQIKNNWHALDLANEHFVDVSSDKKIECLNFIKYKNLIQFRGNLVYLLLNGDYKIPDVELDVLFVDDFWSYYDQRKLVKAKHIVFSDNVYLWQLSKLAVNDYHWIKQGAFVLPVL